MKQKMTSFESTWPPNKLDFKSRERPRSYLRNRKESQRPVLRKQLRMKMRLQAIRPHQNRKHPGRPCVASKSFKDKLFKGLITILLFVGG
jgi:hypothetical protein